MIDILVPVLNRPHRVRPLLESIERSTTLLYRVLFIADPGDDAELEAIAAVGAECVVSGGSYAAKINYGVTITNNPLVFFGADDLKFREDWQAAAIRRISPPIEVVGVNDLCSKRVRRGQHATHFLVTRRYCLTPQIDGSPGPLCERYSHWFVDDEFVAVALHRGVIEFATDSVVEHLHHMNGKAPMDSTYARGQEYHRIDRKRFHRRRHLWTSPSA